LGAEEYRETRSHEIEKAAGAEGNGRVAREDQTQVGKAQEYDFEGG